MECGPLRLERERERERENTLHARDSGRASLELRFPPLKESLYGETSSPRALSFLQRALVRLQRKEGETLLKIWKNSAAQIVFPERAPSRVFCSAAQRSGRVVRVERRGGRAAQRGLQVPGLGPIGRRNAQTRRLSLSLSRYRYRYRSKCGGHSCSRDRM